MNSPSNSGAAEETAAAAEAVEDPIPDSAEALADQLRAIDELVDGLTAEMNALRQRYESQNSMVPGYVIQEQMDELNRRFTRAQARQAAIEAKMVKLGLPVRKSPELRRPLGRSLSHAFIDIRQITPDPFTQRTAESASSRAASSCRMNRWASWMRGVELEGTSRRKSARGATAPPPRPVRPIVIRPFAREDRRALRTLR